MTRGKLITICILILAICGILWGYIGLKEEAENLQKTIDIQKEMIYNKDNQIIEMTKMISGQEEELIKAYDKIKELEKPLTPEMKSALRGALDTLEKIYEEDILPETATVKTGLEYIPLFVIEGLLMAANLGVTQEELYAVTDYYAKSLRLYKEEDEENGS